MCNELEEGSVECYDDEERRKRHLGGLLDELEMEMEMC
jgi:hypothetical protein